ncbi:MAG: EthD family reductase [Comamonadaceae bacterium]|nr:EthD family reductase [Pseudomonadota bacterium]MBS0608143.1 EthD family reductase [Pseudomonadota bacterium]MDE2413489.1 EthD family reductase [Comamonadaceae bacterium]
MTAKLFAVYKQPADPKAFDDYYVNKHVPLAKTIPGLLSYEVSRGDVLGMQGKHESYLIAILEFESVDSIAIAMSSPQGQATAADLANFASAGVDIMFSEVARI